MATVGIVKALSGEVTATDPSGNIRILKVGDSVADNETIKTATGSNVHIDFNNNGFATLGSGSSLTLDRATLAEIASVAEDAKPAQQQNAQNDQNVEALQQQIEEALARGEDPTALLEAAAAGPGAGGGGAQEGGSFVLVEQNADRGQLTPGYDTGTFGNPIQEIQEYTGLFTNWITINPILIPNGGPDTPPPGPDTPPGAPTLDVNGQSWLINEAWLQNGSYNTNGNNPVYNLSFAVESNNGFASITIGGKNYAINADGSLNGFTAIDGNNGTLTDAHVTTNSTGSWTLSFKYEHKTPTDHEDGEAQNIADDVENWGITVFTVSGASASTSLTIDVIDDISKAYNDAVELQANDGYPPEMTVEGSVLTGEYTITDSKNSTTTGTSGDADSFGADNPANQEVTWGTEITYALDNTGTEIELTVGANNILYDNTGDHYGSLILHDDGSYTYTRPTDREMGGKINLDYSITDTDNDSSQATLTIDVAQITLPNAGQPDASGDEAIIKEADIEQGNANIDGSLIGIDYGSFGPADSDAFVWSTPDETIQAKVGDQWVDVTWSSQGEKLVGTAGGIEVISVTYDQDNKSYEVDLQTALKHGTEDLIQLDLDYTIKDSQGNERSNTVTVNVQDDTPSVASDGVIVSAGDPVDYNIHIVLDNSTSMYMDIYNRYTDGGKNPDNQYTWNTETGNNRMHVAIEALKEMVTEYMDYASQTGAEVVFSFYNFSTAGASGNTGYVKSGDSVKLTGQDVLDYLDGKKTTVNRGSSTGGTDYSELNNVQSQIESELDTYQDYTTRVYFLSDGEPDGDPGTDLRESKDTPDDWAKIKDDVEVIAVGIDLRDSTDAQDELQKVATTDDKVINVSITSTDYSQLASELKNTLEEISLTGNLLGNDDMSVDGTVLTSIEYDGQTYTFDGSNDTVTIDLDTPSSNIVAKITINENGDFIITSSDQINDPIEGLKYTIKDGDGDISSGEITINVGPNSDDITGTSGDDVLVGTIADNTLEGGAGNDSLYGGDGNDTLIGGDGNDILVGGAGNDLLVGGAGNDLLIGGAGENTLTGGSGSDTFKFISESLDGKTDTITDFHLGKVGNDTEADILDLSDVLTGATKETLDQFIKLEVKQIDGDKAEVTLSIDQNGATGGDSFQQLATITMDGVTLGNDANNHAQELMNQLIQNDAIKF